MGFNANKFKIGKQRFKMFRIKKSYFRHVHRYLGSLNAPFTLMVVEQLKHVIKTFPVFRQKTLDFILLGYNS